jgi:Flp pilus assembly protein TadD
VLCEVLTGAPPYRGRGGADLLQAARADLADAFARLDRSGADAELVRLTKGCLDPDPGRRPADAGAVAEAVTAYRRSVEERLRAAELARVEEHARALRARQRLRWGTALAATVLLALAVLGGGGWLWQRRQAEADRKAAAAKADADRQAAATEAAAEADLDAATQAAQAGEDAQAREALERAQGRLAGGGPPELQDRLRRLRDDLDFAAQLEEARMKALEVTKESTGLNWAGADAAFAQAFAERGLDVTGPGAAAALERIGRSPVKARVMTALDAWADARRQSEAAGWEGLLAAAGRADDSADGARQQMRAALLRGDKERLKALAGRPDIADWPPADAVMLGTALQRAGEREDGIRVLRAAQRRNASDFWLNAWLAVAFGFDSSASRVEGIGFARAAVASRPRNAATHQLLGLLLRQEGRPAEAEGEYREALRHWPDDPVAHTNLGNLLAHQNKAAEAEREFREAIRFKPDYPLAHNNLGNLLAGQDRPEEAEKEYREALRIKIDLPEAHIGLGNLLSKQGQAAEAEKEFREALRIKPDFPLAHYNLGNLLDRQRKAAEAEREYREALRLQPDLPEAHGNLGVLLAGQNKEAEAEKEYREAIRLRPDFPLAHYNLGNLLHRQGKAAEAEQEYREALRVKPDYPEAHGNLGGALLEQGQFREALAELRRGRELGARYPSAARVKDVERLLELDALLTCVRGGAAEPADADAALGFARVCQLTKRHAAAARLSAAAFDAAPEAVNDLRTGVRYDAACSAALAGCGQGSDAPAGEMERARLRAQALAWLRADLDARSKQAGSWSPGVSQEAVQALHHWRDDLDLAGVRDADALDRLPEAERAEWRRLWADVDALLQKASPEKK